MKNLKELKHDYEGKVHKDVYRLFGTGVGEAYDFKVGPKSVSLKDKSYSTPTFTSKIIDNIGNNLVVLFEFFRTERKDSENIKLQEKFPRARGNNTQAYKKMFMLMKEYWEDYCAYKKIDGLIFVSSELTHKNLVDFFVERFPADRYKDDLYQLLSENLKDVSIFYGKLSGNFIKEGRRFLKKKEIMDEVIQREPLLSGYKQDLYQLYRNPVSIHFANGNFEVEMKNTFDVLAIRHEDKETLVNCTNNELYNYFNDFKENQRLVNLLENPMDNFEHVLKELHVYIDEPEDKQGPEYELYVEYNENVKKQFEQLENELDGWENAESNMGKILEQIKAQDKLVSIVDNYDIISKSRIQVYSFSTEQRHFYIFTNIKFNYNKKKYDEVNDFKFFITKEKKCPELNEYVHQTLFKGL